VLVTGPNGAGKTNLLEALHVGSQGFSPRTRAEPRLVRFGEQAARVRLSGSEGGSPVQTDVTIVPREGKRVLLNGTVASSAEALRSRLATLVFTPDRLAVVKGGPLVRRTYVDRMLGRVFPARAALPGEYARVLAQRNEALRRVRGGLSSSEAVVPWTEQLAGLGAELDAARARLVGLLAPDFREHGAALGLAEATLAYQDRGLTVAELDERLSRDLERGTTGVGPHLRDIELRAGARELRGFGSQGEQRLAVLALLLAEAELLAEQRGEPPLLLLDDVLSELDRDRAAALVSRLPEGGQAVLTSTSAEALPPASRPSLLLRVRREDDRSFVEAGSR
jgi:DNA replication and repair protein RecF